MPLSPYLTQLLEVYELERLYALLNWLEPDLLTSSEKLAIQDQKPDGMPTLTKLDTMSALTEPLSSSMNDRVMFSLLDEFGPQAMNKACFQTLSHCVSQRFAAQGNLG